MRIALCITTYQRPLWLAAALQSLAELLLDGQSAQVAVVVVDNDSHGSARGLIETFRDRLCWPLVYEVEPQQGVSFARNCAVRAALAWGADFLAFLDDDETASPDWLAKLLAARERYRADVVTGPVVPRYEPGVADWAVRGRFFERPRHSSGTRLDYARTGNCLISCAMMAGLTEPFDPAFALTGGEDTHFFSRAHRKGASIVWADDAIVYERVPSSRATVRWLLRRAYRGGASYSLCERMLHRTTARIFVRICTGLARSLQGLLLLVPSLFLGKARVVRALQTGCIGAGLVAGALRFSYREYTVVQGQ